MNVSWCSMGTGSVYPPAPGVGTACTVGYSMVALYRSEDNASEGASLDGEYQGLAYGSWIWIAAAEDPLSCNLDLRSVGCSAASAE